MAASQVLRGSRRSRHWWSTPPIGGLFARGLSSRRVWPGLVAVARARENLSVPVSRPGAGMLTADRQLMRTTFFSVLSEIHRRLPEPAGAQLVDHRQDQLVHLLGGGAQ